ncbi:hypothetical protein NDU88_004725 [Pleurodeles waltl]|uniref:Uncharacterized protein n=1 Tax=Pleurodeles waltl TaxID=8319 RepID=A0AAV7VLJ9_PLEWA|nr:hypothetical protein NDU88_004725 [Pleurodeles waltl]
MEECISEGLHAIPLWQCDGAPRSALEWKYLGGTSPSRDALSEEAEPQWSRSRQENPEMVVDLNPVSNGARCVAGEEGN